jgi:branched-chain amino acid transport system permease protein
MKIFKKIFIRAGFLSLLFFPAYLSTYWLSFLFTLLINIALAGGINLLWGFAGYLNLGYMSFFGLGAYGTAILLLKGWSFLLGLGIGLLLLLPIAGLLSLLLFRLQNLYFSVATLGILILLEESAGKVPFLSGGLEGLTLPLGNHSWECYFLSLGLACVSLGANFLLNNKRLGFQLRMIQEDEKTAQSVGVPIYSSKIKAYLLGASIAFLAGGIYVRQGGYIGPSSAFGLSVAIPPVIMALIGGGQRWWGPLIGAIILTGLQEILWTGLDRWGLSGYGIVLILLGIFWTGFGQEGTMGCFANIRSRGGYQDRSLTGRQR